MTDLWLTAKRPFIRMSEGDGCGYRIGSMIMEGGSSREPDMALRMGSGLEPVIVQWLADHGMHCWFTGEDQLRLAYDSPFTKGHCDGFISADPDALSSWAKRNLPAVVQELFADGDLLLMEIKTMALDSFNDFKKNGLTPKDALFRKYAVQIQDYLNTANNPEFDESWPDALEEVEVADAFGNPVIHEVEIRGSDSFRKLLNEQGFSRPEACLVVAFCPANKQYAFDIIPIRRDAFNAKRKRLEERVVIPMRVEGRMPEPDFDGHDPECFFCPVKNVCPAANSSISELLALESIPLDAPPSVESPEAVDELLTRYFYLRDAIKEMELEQQTVRLELESMADVGSRYYTGQNVFHFAPVKGRRSIDTEKLAEFLQQHGVTMDEFMKQGAGYTRLYAKPLYGPSYDKKAEK